jgi:hypothetical protein
VVAVKDHLGGIQMSKTIDKQPFMNWIKSDHDSLIADGETDLAAGVFRVAHAIQSGRFDSPEMDHEKAYWAREGLVKHQEQEVQRLRAALEEIADYDVSEKHGYLDEWNEAASFNECQIIARKALSNTVAQEQIKPAAGWYCPTCNQEVPCNHVTFDERHDERAGGCGGYVGEPAQEPIGADRVREYYKSLNPSISYDFDKITGMKNTLELLGITIPGINQREKEE